MKSTSVFELPEKFKYCLPSLVTRHTYFKYINILLLVMITLAASAKKPRIKEVPVNVDDITSELNNLSFDVLSFNANIPDHVPRVAEDSITVSDFECSATDLLELSCIVESIITRH